MTLCLLCPSVSFFLFPPILSPSPDITPSSTTLSLPPQTQNLTEIAYHLKYFWWSLSVLGEQNCQFEVFRKFMFPLPPVQLTEPRHKTELKHLLEAKCGSPWHYERQGRKTESWDQSRHHSKFQAIYWGPVLKQSEKKGNDKIIQNGPIARPAGCYASTFLLKERVHWLEPSSTRWHD